MLSLYSAVRQEWQLRELPWRLVAQRSRTSTLPTVVPPCSGILWPPHAQNVLCQVALTCSHCDVVNQMQQIRCIGYWSVVALSSPMWQITADVPVSDIVIGLTLLYSVSQNLGIQSIFFLKYEHLRTGTEERRATKTITEFSQSYHEILVKWMWLLWSLMETAAYVCYTNNVLKLKGQWISHTGTSADVTMCK